MTTIQARMILVLALLFWMTCAANAQLVSDGPHLFHRANGDVEAVWVERDEKKTHVFKPGEPIRIPQFKDLLGQSLKLRRHTPLASKTPAPKKLLVLADVEGQYTALLAFLKAAKVVDDQGRWSFGEGHLVTVGDMVDRGDQVTEVLWLMYRLAGEAQASGGRVHFILGNHEFMIMGGDIRYVAPKYKRVCEILGTPYETLVGPDTELGRWLRSCNSVERIGDMVFVHAGISPELPVTEKTMDDVNQAIRDGMGVSKKNLEARNRRAYLLIGSRGPLWYRGYFRQHAEADPKNFGPRPTVSQMDAILEGLGARTIVVGHTHVDSPRFLFGRRVLAIDVAWTRPDKVRGLWIRGEKSGLIDIRGQQYTLPAASPEPVRKQVETPDRLHGPSVQWIRSTLRSHTRDWSRDQGRNHSSGRAPAAAVHP